jgi:hypothetical protein
MIEMKQTPKIAQDHHIAVIASALFLISIWLLPGIVLFANGYALEFDYIQNVRVAASVDQGYLLPLDFGGYRFMAEHQGSELLRLVLTTVSGLSIQELQSFPIGAVLVPLMFFVLARELVGTKVAALLSVSVAFDPTVVFGSYSTTVYAWSRPLLLVFLFLYVKLLKNKNSAFVLLSVLVFVGLFTVYWTGSALMVSFAFLVNILAILFLSTSEHRRTLAPKVLTLSLALTLLVIYLGFGETVYRLLPVIVGQGSAARATSAFFSLGQRALQLAGLAGPDPEATATYGSGSVVNTIQIFRYLLMALPVFWLVIRQIRKTFMARRLELNHDAPFLVLWSLVGVLLTHILINAAYGHASTRYVALFGPLIAVIALDQCNATKRVKVGFAAILGLLACVSFIIAFPRSPQRASWAEAGAASNWFLDSAARPVLVSNVGTYGMFSMASAPQAPAAYDCYGDDEYAALIGEDAGDSESLEPDGYVTIDRKITDHELCPGFRYFEPLSSHLDEMDRNVRLDPIYDNGTIRILLPMHFDLTEHVQ